MLAFVVHYQYSNVGHHKWFSIGLPRFMQALSLHSILRGRCMQFKRPRLRWHLLTQALLSAWGKPASQCRSSNTTRISSANMERPSPQESRISQTQLHIMISHRQTRSHCWYYLNWSEGTSALSGLLIWMFHNRSYIHIGFKHACFIFL